MCGSSGGGLVACKRKEKQVSQVVVELWNVI